MRRWPSATRCSTASRAPATPSSFTVSTVDSLELRETSTVGHFRAACSMVAAGKTGESRTTPAGWKDSRLCRAAFSRLGLREPVLSTSSKPASLAALSRPSITSAKKALRRSDTSTPRTVEVRLASALAMTCG